MVGDTAGFVDVPSLKGIHYAMKSGMLAARTIFEALKKGDTTAASLVLLRRGDPRQLHPARYGEDPQHASGVQVGLLRRRTQGGAHDAHRRSGVRRHGSTSRRTPREPKVVTPARQVQARRQAHLQQARRRLPLGQQHPRRHALAPRSSARTSRRRSPRSTWTCAPPVSTSCRSGKLVVNFSNCVDCKATDVLGPRWKPREGGAGTKYKRM